MFNRTTFFAYARKSPFGGKLSQAQVDGCNAVLDVWDLSYSSNDQRFLAYILATVFHETGGTFTPVREGFKATDVEARKVVAKRRYGKEDATSDGKLAVNIDGSPIPITGHVYYGRGFCQLTWKNNYYEMGLVLGIDLVNDPDLALDLNVSARIVVEGMLRGLSLKGDFTGKSVEDYFTKDVEDPVGARRVVNGTDKAKLIAGYYESFKGALQAADVKTPQPDDVKKEDAKSDDIPATSSTTVMTGAVGIAASAGATLIGGISNPFSLIAFTLIVFVGAIMAYLFYSGKLTVNRKPIVVAT